MCLGVFWGGGFFVCLLGGAIPVTGFTEDTDIDQFESTNRSKSEGFVFNVGYLTDASF